MSKSARYLEMKFTLTRKVASNLRRDTGIRVLLTWCDK